MGYPSLYIDLTQDLDVIWGNIKRKRRGDIKRAERLGVKVLFDKDFVHYDEWLTLFSKSHEKLDIPLRPRLFNEKGYVFLAFHNGELHASEKFLKRNKSLITHIAISKRYDENKKTVAGLAHALLIWEAIKWAKENGFKEFDFGGYNPNRLDFRNNSEWKASFGGVPVYRESL